MYYRICVMYHSVEIINIYNIMIVSLIIEGTSVQMMHDLNLLFLLDSEHSNHQNWI